jgi:hypothetical protein
MLRAPAEEVNGLIDTDEDFLRRHGVSAFSRYSVVPGASPRRIMPSKFPGLEVAEQDDGAGEWIAPNSRNPILSSSF